MSETATTPRTGQGHLRRVLRGVRHDDRGQITPWTMVATLIIIVLAGLVLDQGLAMAAKVRAVDLAQAAARAGAREINLTVYRSTGTVQLDPAAATIAARTFLTQSGLAGTAWASTTTVTVTVLTSRRTHLLHLVGVDEFAIRATATAAASTGVRTGT